MLTYYIISKSVQLAFCNNNCSGKGSVFNRFKVENFQMPLLYNVQLNLIIILEGIKNSLKNSGTFKLNANSNLRQSYFVYLEI